VAALAHAPERSSATATSAFLPDEPPQPPAPDGSTALPTPAPSVAGLTPMSDGDAHTQIEQMPVQLDLGELGAGIDLDPLIRRFAPATASERKLP
jgi:hypothetical protein